MSEAKKTEVEWFEYIVEGNVKKDEYVLSDRPCPYAIHDQTGRLNCIRSEGTVGFCRNPCPYERKGGAVDGW